MTDNEIHCYPVLVKHADDAQTYAMDFTNALHGRTISSVDAIDGGGLTVANEVVNSASYTDDKTGVTVAANSAVQYDCSAGTVDTEYEVKVTVTLSDGSTLIGIQDVHVKG